VNNAELLHSGAKAPATEAVFRLIYRSQCRIPPAQRDAELGNILRIARTKNVAAGISGALLLYDDWFAQTLEGPEGPIRDLYAKIAKDPRHASVDVREEGFVGARVFSRWSMALVGEHGDLDTPLVATPHGTTPGAPRRTTPEQEKVLDLMRDATRGYGMGS
jgi:hypothetical protein